MKPEDQSEDMTSMEKVRENSTGRKLTNAQFQESWAVAGIIEREIRKSGTFKEKLGDYAHAYSRSARSERISPFDAEKTIRNQFQSRYGQSMNDHRILLQSREENITPEDREHAYGNAREIGDALARSQSMSFRRAYDEQATQMSESLGITERCAKELMKEEFRQMEGHDLYDWTKGIVAERSGQNQDSRDRNRSNGHDQTREDDADRDYTDLGTDDAVERANRTDGHDRGSQEAYPDRPSHKATSQRTQTRRR